MAETVKIEGWSGLGDEILFEIKSPAFSTRYPHLINPELITADAFRAADRTWRRNAHARTVTAFLLRDVYVAGDGIVFNRAMEPFLPSLWPSTEDQVAKARSAIEAAIADRALPRHDVRAVLCRKAGNQNYGHFLIELLPRAVIARRQLGPELGVVVHSGAPALLPVIDRCLELIGCPERLVIRAAEEPHHHEELVVVVGLTRHGSYMSPLAPAAVDQMAEGIPSGPGRGAKIYVSRLQRTKRLLSNQEELLPILARHGFTVVTPGELSLDEQCRCFREARIVVGVMGAELTNIVFCASGARVLALTPQGMPDTFFWFLAQHRQLDYTELRGPTPQANERPWNLPFSVSPQDLEAALERMDGAPD